MALPRDATIAHTVVPPLKTAGPVAPTGRVSTNDVFAAGEPVRGESPATGAHPTESRDPSRAVYFTDGHADKTTPLLSGSSPGAIHESTADAQKGNQTPVAASTRTLSDIKREIRACNRLKNLRNVVAKIAISVPAIASIGMVIAAISVTFFIPSSLLALILAISIPTAAAIIISSPAIHLLNSHTQASIESKLSKLQSEEQTILRAQETERTKVFEAEKVQKIKITEELEAEKTRIMAAFETGKTAILEKAKRTKIANDLWTEKVRTNNPLEDARNTEIGNIFKAESSDKAAILKAEVAAELGKTHARYIDYVERADKTASQQSKSFIAGQLDLNSKLAAADLVRAVKQATKGAEGKAYAAVKEESYFYYPEGEIPTERDRALNAKLESTTNMILELKFAQSIVVAAAHAAVTAIADEAMKLPSPPVTNKDNYQTLYNIACKIAYPYFHEAAFHACKTQQEILKISFKELC